METTKKKKKISKHYRGQKPKNSHNLTNSPKELSSDSMAIIKKAQKILFRPNNYRRQIEVKKKNNSTIKKIKVLYAVKPGKRNKLIFVKNYKPNVMIQYGKHKLTAIYCQNIISGVKETYLFQGKTTEIQRKITNKVTEIENKLDKALRAFSRQFKLNLPYERPIWSRYEEWIKGEEFIDSIPREVIIHDTFFKKVYAKGIEFKNTKKGETPGVHIKNYIKNRAIEDIAPEIVQAIEAQNPLRALINKVNSINDLTKYPYLIEALTPHEQKELEKWTFQKFGIAA